MRRKIYDKMLKWKKESQGKTALMIEGARRVGKSWICREFGKNEYESTIFIDFNEESDDFIRQFNSFKGNLDGLFFFLQAYFGVSLVSRNSLIVFDEVQKNPTAREMIKYLVQDMRYDYIETGSLVSIESSIESITIPSEEVPLELCPMDFEEFLWACGDELLFNATRIAFESKAPVGQSLHRKLMTRLNQYMTVGGMPQAVAAFIGTNNLTNVEDAKKAIIHLYRQDIGKSSLSTRIRLAFDLIPSELSRTEKRFVFSDIEKGSTANDNELVFAWLNDAKLVNLCFNSADPNIGLRLSLEKTKFKCYLCDTGLLLTLAFDDNEAAKAEIMRKLALGKLEVNKGMLMENLVAQMFRANGRKLYYYSSYDKANASNRMEVDFLITKNSITNRHNICPVEVKSTDRYTFTSIRKYISKFSEYTGTPYILHTRDVEVKDGFIFLPLYMAGML